MKRKRLLALLGSVSLALAFTVGAGVNDADAAAVIVSGDIALGVNDLGHLNVADPTGAVVAANTPGGAVGVATRLVNGTTWLDATAPGCLCEGWGASASGVSGYANVAVGTAGLTLDSFASTATTATSSVHLTALPGLAVTQAYAPSAAPTALFEDLVTITNTTGGTVTDVRYVRVMDWDIPPTEFNEYVTIQGTGTTTLLEKSHNDGFDTADPLGGGGIDLGRFPGGLEDIDFVDAGPTDHGAYFRFNFGDLADGESYSFKIFYGAAANEADALAALGAVGTELYSLGQYSGDPTGGGPATYMFAFSGVGGEVIVPPPTGVPEPGTLLLMGSGLLGLYAARRRFKA